MLFKSMFTEADKMKTWEMLTRTTERKLIAAKVGDSACDCHKTVQLESEEIFPN